MPNIVFQNAAGERREIFVRTGAVIMRAAIEQGIAGIIAECGGAAACGTCHVYADATAMSGLPLPESNEEAMLDFTAEPRAPNSRLSCQLKATDELEGAVFTIPAMQL